MTKRHAIAAATICASFMLAVPAFAQEIDRTSCVEALRLYHEQDFDRSYEQTEICIDESGVPPNKLVPVYSIRATINLRNENTDDALEDLGKALEINPAYTPAYRVRGALYAMKGAYNMAEKDLTMAIKLSPNTAESYIGRAMLYAKKRDYIGAIEDYTAALRLEPDNAAYYNNRGSAYSSFGEYGPAMEDFDAALELEPDYISAYLNRGNLHSRMGRYDKAEQDYQAVLDKKPDSFDAHFSRGTSRMEAGAFEKAAQDFKASLGDTQNRRRPYAALLQYIATERAGNDGEAGLQNIAEELDLDEWPGALIRLYLGDTDIDSVMTEAGTNSEQTVAESQCEAYYYVAQHLLLNGDTAKARSYFEKAVETDIRNFLEYTGAKAELDRMTATP